MIITSAKNFDEIFYFSLWACLNFVNLVYFNYKGSVSSSTITNLFKFDLKAYYTLFVVIVEPEPEIHVAQDFIAEVMISTA